MMSSLRFWNNEASILEKEIRARMENPEASLLQLDDRTGVIAKYFDARERLQTAAEKAAPYVHSRMSPVSEATGGGWRDLSRLTDDDLDALERISRKIAESYGDPDGKIAAEPGKGKAKG